MDITEVDEVARGRVWIGSDALDIGLVDRIGGLDDAVASAASLADLEQDTYGVKYVKRELTISEQILMQYAKLLGALFGEAGDGADGLQVLIQRFAMLLQDPFELLDAWNDPRGVYLHCFCELQ